MPKKLVAKVYVTTVKQSFKIMARKTTQSRTYSGIKFEIYIYILKKNGSLQLVQDYRKLN